jgi:hypothetical protein
MCKIKKGVYLMKVFRKKIVKEKCPIKKETCEYYNKGYCKYHNPIEICFAFWEDYQIKNGVLKVTET